VDLTPSRLSVWAVSDGRAGIQAQALGLAEAVARLTPADVEIRNVNWRGLVAALPWWLHPGRPALLNPHSDLIPPWPDIWIATGRATIPLSIRVKSWSGGRTFVVQSQNPRAPASRFDLIIPPHHDGLSGPNVFPIIGSPHRITKERLALEAAQFADLISPLKSPKIAVLIGGTSKTHRLGPERARQLASQIRQAVSHSGGSLMMTMSRRTPPQAARILAEATSDLPGFVWSGEGPNPYFAMLEGADHILVTEDSTNMMMEAAAIGKPVHRLRLDGNGRKFNNLYRQLDSLGISQPFESELKSWTVPPLDETGRAAQEILNRFDRSYPGRRSQ